MRCINAYFDVLFHFCSSSGVSGLTVDVIGGKNKKESGEVNFLQKLLLRLLVAEWLTTDFAVCSELKAVFSTPDAFDFIFPGASRAPGFPVQDRAASVPTSQDQAGLPTPRPHKRIPL